MLELITPENRKRTHRIQALDLKCFKKETFLQEKRSFSTTIHF